MNERHPYNTTCPGGSRQHRTITSPSSPWIHHPYQGPLPDITQNPHVSVTLDWLQPRPMSPFPSSFPTRLPVTT